MAEDTDQGQGDIIDPEVMAGSSPEEPAQNVNGNGKKKPVTAHPAKVEKEKKEEKTPAGWKQNFREALVSFLDSLNLGALGNFLKEFLHLERPQKNPEKKPENQPQTAAPAKPEESGPSSSPASPQPQPDAELKRESSGAGNDSVVLKMDGNLSSPEDYLCTTEEAQTSPSLLFLDNMTEVTQSQTSPPVCDVGVTLQMTQNLSLPLK